MKEEGVVSMCITNGLFVIGKLIGGNKLTDPRIFMVIDDGKRVQMSPLPGTPPFIAINPEALRYPMPETPENKNILDLYDRVTHPQNVVVPVSKPTLVTPGGVSLN
jgi:hypothetical protein